MPGVIYRALSRLTYDFSTVPASTSITYTIFKGIDVSAYREANLMVRLHSVNISNGTPSFTVQTVPEAPTAEDPASDFIFGLGISSIGTVLLSSQTGLAPAFYISTIVTPFGGFLRGKLIAYQPQTITTLYQVTISVDINAKS